MGRSHVGLNPGPHLALENEKKLKCVNQKYLELKKEMQMKFYLFQYQELPTPTYSFVLELQILLHFLHSVGSPHCSSYR